MASKDLDKVEEEVKAGESRQIPTIKSYLDRTPVLFNLSWPLLGVPDTGSIFFSGDSANTMNLFDQFIVSRGLHFGESGLKARAGSVQIFRPTDMATGSKRRPKSFDKKTKKGFSDHFPIEMMIDTV
ncbi:MAG: hypothetical protein CAF45_001980 [Nitrospira sp. CG24E]|nr:MAG: hypothetical protein CAF45_001980 [Nitrospira sp. CG24E]